MSDLAKRLNIMADWFDQDPEHAYKNTIALLREAAAALAPTSSEQRASTKPHEAEMREVLAKIKTLLNLPASILDSNDRAALAELRTYAATERAHAREDRAGEIAELHGIIRELHWMARRYADGRMTYAVGNFNGITRRLCDADIIRARDYQADGTPWARDGTGKRSYDGLSDDEASMGVDWVARDQAMREQAVEAERASARREAVEEAAVPNRFFVDHGVVHDRATGKHVRTDDSLYPHEDGADQACALMNGIYTEAMLFCLSVLQAEIDGADETLKIDLTESARREALSWRDGVFHAAKKIRERYASSLSHPEAKAEDAEAPPPQRNDAGGEPNPYVGVTDQNSAEIEARLSSPPDPLDRPVTYRGLIDTLRHLYPSVGLGNFEEHRGALRLADALDRSASLHTGER